MRRRPTLRSIAVLAASVVVLAACSGDDSSDDDPPETAPTTTEAGPPTGVGPGVIDLPEDIGGIEGVAVDPGTGRVFVGDLTDGEVWVGDADGGPFEVFAAAEDSGRSVAVGLTTDPDAGLLYVATGPGGTVDVLDLEDGSLQTSIELPSADGSFINDIAVAPDGVVYVTDSGAPLLYRSEDGTTAEVWFDYTGGDLVPDTGILLNGIVADETVVLAAHTVTGQIVRLDRASGDADLVDLGDQPGGRDGLLLCDSTLYGVDVASFNGGEDPTILVTELDDAATSGTPGEPLSDPSFSTPATIAALDDHLIVTNAQFDTQPPELPFTLTVLPAPCPTG